MAFLRNGGTPAVRRYYYKDDVPTERETMAFYLFYKYGVPTERETGRVRRFYKNGVPTKRGLD